MIEGMVVHKFVIYFMITVLIALVLFVAIVGGDSLNPREDRMRITNMIMEGSKK